MAGICSRLRITRLGLALALSMVVLFSGSRELILQLGLILLVVRFRQCSIKVENVSVLLRVNASLYNLCFATNSFE